MKIYFSIEKVFFKLQKLTVDRGRRCMDENWILDKNLLQLTWLSRGWQFMVESPSPNPFSVSLPSFFRQLSSQTPILALRLFFRSLSLISGPKFRPWSLRGFSLDGLSEFSNVPARKNEEETSFFFPLSKLFFSIGPPTSARTSRDKTFGLLLIIEKKRCSLPYVLSTLSS